MKCKHINGSLSEFAIIENYKLVKRGQLSETGDNNVGNILGYVFECFECGKVFKYSGRPKQKWLNNIHNQI